MKKNRSIYILLTLFLFLSGCSPSVPTPLPIETVFAATHAAMMAQTAAAMPKESATPTLLPTLRPTLTPIPTSTLLVLPPTHTPTPTVAITATNITSGSGKVLYACNILNSSPASGYVAKPKEFIKWNLRVENIGTTKWWPDTMFIEYISGSAFHKKDHYALGSPTPVGESEIFVIKLEAPKEPGTYTTTWALQKGIHTFCYAKLRITVKK